MTPNCMSLSSTTEAIVDAVFYSHYFTKYDRTQPHVDLVMDLAPESDIHCMISVGAWKRLCTNIVNNALKYTPSGHVKVSLDVSEGGSGKKHAILTVSDTGIGMSPEFLRERLFKSFAQEDSFATGTGLGMSLVAELIKEFGGEIEVTSKKGEGTTMVVTIPVEIPQEATATELGPETDLSGTCVGYLEPGETEESFSSNYQALTDAAKRTLRNIGATVIASRDASIVAVLEEHFVQSPKDLQSDKQRWLVLCDSFASATRLRERYQGANVEFVPQPYGPERLSAALHILRKSLSEQSNAGAGSAPPTPGAAATDASSSFKYRRNRAMSALPSPPIDVTLEYLTLSSPNANTVKASTQDDSTDAKTPQVANFPSDNAVAGSRDTPLSPPADSSTQLPDSLLLLLVDDNVSLVLPGC